MTTSNRSMLFSNTKFAYICVNHVDPVVTCGHNPALALADIVFTRKFLEEVPELRSLFIVYGFFAFARYFCSLVLYLDRVIFHAAGAAKASAHHARTHARLKVNKLGLVKTPSARRLFGAGKLGTGTWLTKKYLHSNIKISEFHQNRKTINYRTKRRKIILIWSEQAILTHLECMIHRLMCYGFGPIQNNFCKKMHFYFPVIILGSEITWFNQAFNFHCKVLFKTISCPCRYQKGVDSMRSNLDWMALKIASNITGIVMKFQKTFNTWNYGPDFANRAFCKGFPSN